jgi:hypothetical protein
VPVAVIVSPPPTKHMKCPMDIVTKGGGGGIGDGCASDEDYSCNNSAKGGCCNIHGCTDVDDYLDNKCKMPANSLAKGGGQFFRQLL